MTCAVSVSSSDGTVDIALHMTQTGGGNGTKNWFQVTGPTGLLIVDQRQSGPATGRGEWRYTISHTLLVASGNYQVTCIAWHDNSVRVGQASASFTIVAASQSPTPTTSASPTPSASPSASPTPSLSPSASPSASPTPTAGDTGNGPPTSPVVTCSAQPAVSDGSQDIALHMTQTGGGNGTKNWFQVTDPNGNLILDLKQGGPATGHDSFDFLLDHAALTGPGVYHVDCIAWHDNSVRDGGAASSFVITPAEPFPGLPQLTISSECSAQTHTVWVTVLVVNAYADFDGTLSLGAGSDGPRTVVTSASGQAFAVDTLASTLDAGSGTFTMTRASVPTTTSLPIAYAAASCGIGGPQPVEAQPPTQAVAPTCGSPYSVISIPEVTGPEIESAPSSAQPATQYPALLVAQLGVDHYEDGTHHVVSGTMSLPAGSAVTIRAVPVEGFTIANGPWTFAAPTVGPCPGTPPVTVPVSSGPVPPVNEPAGDPAGSPVPAQVASVPAARRAAPSSAPASSLAFTGSSGAGNLVLLTFFSLVAGIVALVGRRRLRGGSDSH